MGAKNYYDVLNVPKDANEQEIKKAYRTLTKKYHPDVCKEEGAEEKFKEINEAYSVLSDSQKRAQYDHMGHETFTNASKGQYTGGGFGGAGFNADFGGFGDIFDAFFGGGAGQRRGPRGPQPGADLLMRVQVTLKDAVLGTSKDIDVMHTEACEECEGTGSSTKKTRVCPRCGGSGQERRENRTPFGSFVSMTTCSQCRGRGKIPEQTCSKCGGSGHKKVKRTITVNIPAGIESGMRLRMEGYGEAGDPGASNGDLFIEVDVLADSKFKRLGDNLETSVSVSAAGAAVGTKVDITTIDDREVELKVPAGIQHGTALKIPGEGVRRRGRPGDLLVRVNISIPKDLGDEEKELYKRLLEIESEKKDSKKGGFFQGMMGKKKGSKK
ncbi:chaperone protein DnaJ [Methanolacinia petrolearia DSM 11571]|uniref:Chaperone protein DnaJ n=2 Tax=Methanolacinia TaxID=230355 RepID=E1RID4_METP4|nr:molecular chaperone DnaJ [Methanolacinia petrolearia]ADN35447.1 chaperone protein DnaJ [Methanolacinia petrolearia DSM 11571]